MHGEGENVKGTIILTSLEQKEMLSIKKEEGTMKKEKFTEHKNDLGN